MRFLTGLLIGLLLLGPAAYASETAYKGGSGSSPVPGLNGAGIGNEATIEYLKRLTHFMALPATLNPVYFSADNNAGCSPSMAGPTAGTCLPQGDDSTGNGTAALPYRTPTKCEELMNAGTEVHCIFDSLDTWDAAADEGSDASPATWAYLDVSPRCTDYTQPCAVWSASDPDDHAVFDCVAMGIGDFDAGLFKDQRNTNGGWWAIQNLDFVNCPDDASTTSDLFRQDLTGDMIVLNARATHINGHSNQYHTSHNIYDNDDPDQDLSEFIAINPYCEIPEWTNGGDFSSECFRSAGNASIIVVGGESNTYDTNAVGVNFLIQAAGAGGDVGELDETYQSFIGHTLQNLAAASAGETHQAFLTGPGNNDETNSVALILSSIVGFDNAAGDISIRHSPGGFTGNTANVYLYKNSITNTSTALSIAFPTTTGNSLSLTGACNAVDTAVNIVAISNSCAPLTIVMSDIVADEAGATTAYNIVGNTATAGADFETDSTAQSCANAPWTWNSTADTTPFGSYPELPFCRDASCNQACTTAGRWIFPKQKTIPAFVTGETIRGFTISAGSNIGR